jgi:hypothetical protein
MSQTEIHIGKIKELPRQGSSFEDWCEIVCKIHGATEISEYSETWKETIEDLLHDKLLIIGERIFQYEEHKELEEGDDILEMNRNQDGTISFVTSFYNGGTFLEEMLEVGLNKLEKK